MKRLRKLFRRLFRRPLLRRRTSYAHSGEDLVLLSLFRKKRGGCYVDIGCHHPVNHSTTYLFSRNYGWQGLVVDADPRYLSEFRHFRPRDTVMHAGVGSPRGSAVFYRVQEDAALNTFSAEVAARARARGMTVIETQVEVLPLAELLQRHEIAAIDLLNVDVEGMDLSVLQSNDWSRWRPQVIAVEDHQIDLGAPENSATFRYLRDLGYRLQSKCHYTSIYQDVPTSGG